jgi:hypothetical protein
VGNPQHYGCVILPNHLHEIYEAFVLTGNSPLLTLNSRQDDKETARIRASDRHNKRDWQDAEKSVEACEI